MIQQRKENDIRFSVSDEELLLRFRSGEKAAEDMLFRRYSIVIRRMAQTLFLIGGDKEDLIQEGNIGLYSAMLSFDDAKDASFSTFARTCIRRAQYKAIEASNRKKHAPLNFRISIEGSQGDSEDAYASLPPDESTNPENIVLYHERLSLIYDNIRQSLSSMELSVLKHYLDGEDYVTIANAIGRDKKSVDNAIQRIRGKVRKICLEDF